MISVVMNIMQISLLFLLLRFLLHTFVVTFVVLPIGTFVVMFIVVDDDVVVDAVVLEGFSYYHKNVLQLKMPWESIIVGIMAI